MRRVVVTGMGIVSSIGNNLDEVVVSLREAKPGIVFAQDYADLNFRCQVHGAPKLDPFSRLDPAKATPQELSGETIFFGKGRCSTCHPPPIYSDNFMHDLKAERFYQPAMVNGRMTTTGGPILAAISLALSGVSATSPRGMATPCWLRIWLA